MVLSDLWVLLSGEEAGEHYKTNTRVTGKLFHDGYLEYHRYVEEKKGTANEIKAKQKNKQKPYEMTFFNITWLTLDTI